MLRRCAVRWSVVVGLLVGVAVNCNDAFAQQPNVSREYKLKVAYVYNLTRYVTWPDSAYKDNQSPFVIAVLGHDPFGPSLDVLAQRKRAAGRRIVIRRYDSLDDYEPSHILFISRDTLAELRGESVRRTQHSSVLIVGETADFATAGAGVNFFNDQDGTVGFEVNVDAISRGKLSIDAKLLSIARVVRDTEVPEF